MSIYVPGCGCSSAKLMIIGEAPGRHEVEKGYPFAGPTGALLDQALAYAELPRHECYLTNVVKIRPPNNKLDDLKQIGHSIEEFLPQLWDEIQSINPNCILALGNTALTALTNLKGIEKYRGSILQCKTGNKVVPALHPAALMPHEGALSAVHQWKEFAWIKADVKRAVAQSLFHEYNPPQRTLRVAQNSAEVMRFLSRYQDKDKVALDVETFKTIPQCIGLAFNDWEAMSIPLFPTELSPIHDTVIIWQLLSEFLHDTKIKIMAQNAKFDEKRCRQIGLDWHDCYFDMAMGWHILYPEFPKKLQFISSVITEEPYYKDEGTEFNKGKSKEQNLRQWFLYNAKDAVVEFECCTKILQELEDTGLEDFFWDKIAPLHRLYSDIEDMGILVDEVVRKQLNRKYSSLRDERQAKLVADIANGNPDVYEIYKHFNVMSNGPKNQVAKLLFGFMKLPVRKDTGDDTLKSLANNTVKDPRVKNILTGILEVRKLRKTIGTYIEAEPSLQDSTRFGDIARAFGPSPRIHTQCNINGTETGRTSTGILKPPVSVEKEGVALQTETKHEDVNLNAGGGDLRARYIADPDFVFIEPDLSQAEDRVVCVLAKDWDALKDYERTTFRHNKHGLKDDRHTTTATYVCGMDFDAITDWERQVGKKTRHSGNYGVGKHQHMLTLSKSGIFVSEYKAGQQLERFHRENPKIEGIFWAEIQQALQDNSCVLHTPFGRRRTFFNKWGPELFKEAYSQIPQSTISDSVKFSMVNISKRLGPAYRRDFFFLEESHDSFLALCRMSCMQETCAIIREEMERPIDFTKCTLSRDYQLVIPCEIKVGRRWIEKSEQWPDGMAKYKAQ